MLLCRSDSHSVLAFAEDEGVFTYATVSMIEYFSRIKGPAVTSHLEVAVFCRRPAGAAYDAYLLSGFHPFSHLHKIVSRPLA